VGMVAERCVPWATHSCPIWCQEFYLRVEGKKSPPAGGGVISSIVWGPAAIAGQQSQVRGGLNIRSVSKFNWEVPKSLRVEELGRRKKAS